MPPQPSALNPHVAAPHVSFTHGGAPQKLGTPPPPQVSPVGQVGGHWRRPPHPSAIGPQSPVAHAVFVGTHTPPSVFPPPVPHLLGPPPPQVPASHSPHDA